MRIKCETISEFIECLEALKPLRLFQDTLRISRTRRPKGDGPVYEIGLQISTLVQNPDDSEYLLEAGEICGEDFEDASQEYQGTSEFQRIKDKIESFAKPRGLVILPGTIHA